MAAAAAAARRLNQPSSHLLSESLSVINSINSIVESLNPQNPKTHQNPNPSVLNQFSQYLTPNFVINTIKTLENPYHSLFFFTWASNSTPNPNYYYPSHFCYIAITDKLLSHKLFSLAADLLRTHNRFSDFMVGKFIKAHGDLGHLKSSVKLFNQVKERELEGFLYSFNALLGVLVKANKINYAWGYFGLIAKLCIVNPDVSTYTIMIRGFCKLGMIMDAQKLFDEMSCSKSLFTYNIMIDGLCKKGLMEKAQGLVDRMSLDGSCLPDSMSYTSLIDGYFKKGEFSNAMRCFNEMVEMGNCEPNVLTYNVMINGLCSNGEVDEAKKMVSRMQLSGLRANVVTHTSLLKGFCIARRSNEAIKHFKEMMNLGVDEKSFMVMLKEYCKIRRPDEAIGLLREMRRRNIRPSSASFNSVIRILVKLREFGKAIMLLKQMKQWRCDPNFVSYSEVIIGLVEAKGGRLRDVEILVDEMVQNGHDLDSTLYSCLIRAYCTNGDVRKGVYLFKEMIGKGLVMRKDWFKVFVEEMAKRNLRFEVENVLDEIRRRPGSCDMETYTSVLNECLYRNVDS